jgi:hypothetical protein
MLCAKRNKYMNNQKHLSSATMIDVICYFDYTSHLFTETNSIEGTLCIYIFMYIHVCIYMYVYLFMYVYTCTYIFMYVCRNVLRTQSYDFDLQRQRCKFLQRN